jgi:hypothetical protein
MQTKHREQMVCYCEPARTRHCQERSSRPIDEGIVSGFAFAGDGKPALAVKYTPNSHRDVPRFAVVVSKKVHDTDCCRRQAL